jgi:hypothetical protein
MLELGLDLHLKSMHHLRLKPNLNLELMMHKFGLGIDPILKLQGPDFRVFPKSPTGAPQDLGLDLNLNVMFVLNLPAAPLPPLKPQVNLLKVKFKCVFHRNSVQCGVPWSTFSQLAVIPNQTSLHDPGKLRTMAPHPPEGCPFKSMAL